MILAIGTTVVASASAVVLARHQAAQHHNKARAKALEQNLTGHFSLLQQSMIDAPPALLFDKLEKSLSQFNTTAAAREQSQISPINPEARKAVSSGYPLIMEHLGNAFYSTLSVDEKQVNNAVELHEMFVKGILMNGGILVRGSLEELLASMRKANAVEQGRMDKEYIGMLCSVMEFTLAETIKTLLRGEDRPSTELLSKLGEDVRKLAKGIDARTENRLSF